MAAEDQAFRAALIAYRSFWEEQRAVDSRSVLRCEAHVEALRDWSPLSTLAEVMEWFVQRRASCTMVVEGIPVSECREWYLDSSTGFIRHRSGDFFFVQGLRTTETSSREVAIGWDQPMLTQVGFDGGILGLLRQRIAGIPMYLVEAKAEPGNYRLVQLSPTLQATFANLRRSHGGRAPRFAEFFAGEGATGSVVHFEQWLSEDGGRLTNKRNLAKLIEIPEGLAVDVPDGFRWLSLWQIKELLHQDAWVNPHLRGIIAHL